MSTANRIVLISGTAHRELSHKIALELDVPLANAHVGRFPDGEIDIKVYDDMRGGDVFVRSRPVRRSTTTGSSSCC